MSKDNTNLIQKGPQKSDTAQQLWANNMFTYDVENADCTDKRRNLFLVQGYYRKTRGKKDLLYTDSHILKEVKMRLKKM